MTYWEERQKQLDEQLEKDEEKLKKKLSKIYEKEAAKLEKKIAAFYQQYGTENILEYRNLLIQLDQEDITLLMEQMDEFAKKYPQYADLLPVRENIYKLNRLEGLQTSIRMQQLEIGAINNRELQDHLEKNAQRYVNQTAEVLGFGKNFYSIDSDIVQSFVNAAWSNGTNFSTRIWQNTEKLANYLNTDVSQAFARGDSYQRIIRSMKDRFEKVSRNDMYRLIYTEGTYVKNEASVRPFEEDFDTYRISYVKDGKACQICKKIAQKTFKIKDRQPGVNFPPFHPWCRCSFTVEVEDWDAWIDDYVEKHSSERTDAKKIAEKLGRQSGALSGAWTDENDPFYENRDMVAEDLYTEIRNRKKSYEVKAVAKNSGFSEEEIDKVYDHVFIRDHLFKGGEIRRFDPDYYMAHSWQRLRDGKNIQKHDITMLYHELEEEKIMGDSLEIEYEKAHSEVEKKYNYRKELLEYLKNHKV